MQAREERSYTDIRKILQPEISSDPQLIVYSEKDSSRLRYVLDFIFKRSLRVNYVLTNNPDEFKRSSLPSINYSGSLFDNALHIIPSGFLFENGIREFVPDNIKKNGILYFFPTQGGNMEYDVLSSVFYCISRYEEWLPFEADVHGRFELKNSILFKHGVHKIPVTDIWTGELKTHLESGKRKVNFPAVKYRYISTIDVDNVYAYKAKPWWRVGGALIMDLIKMDLKNFYARIGTVFFGVPDPFDAYSLQIEEAQRNNIPLLYFFLFKNGTKYDRTIDPDHSGFRALFQKLKTGKIAFGIHPSYDSSKNSNDIRREIEHLKKNSGEQIIYSRQHYLRFDIRTTPDQLINAGIQFDFTMGFASGVGFRAGTSIPFVYFDLEKDQPFTLVAVPFVIMDGAYSVYTNAAVSDAEIEINEIMDAIKRTNGLFVTVFHERTFSKNLHPGWKELYLRVQAKNKS